MLKNDLFHSYEEATKQFYTLYQPKNNPMYPPKTEYDPEIGQHKKCRIEKCLEKWICLINMRNLQNSFLTSPNLKLAN